MVKTAMLVLDVQEDFVGEHARMPVAKSHVKPMLDVINRVIEQAHPLGMPIIYIGNEFERSQWFTNWFRNHAAIKGQPGAMLDKRLRVGSDLYFSKKVGDAFSNPQLADFLAKHESQHLVILGLFTEGCVSATAKSALSRGYKVTVLQDAVASANNRRRDKALVGLAKKGVMTTTSRMFLDSIRQQFERGIMMASSTTDEIHSLYGRLITAWNNRNASKMAELFTADGVIIGFDGSQSIGREEIRSHLEPIFENHPTPPFVSKVKDIRLLDTDTALLLAIAGMTPNGKSDIASELNARQTVVAVRREDAWRIELFQNTPAQFHGRPELVEQMTEELRQTLV